MGRFGRSCRPGRRHRKDRGSRAGVGLTGPGIAPEEIANLMFLYPSPRRGRLFQDSALSIRAGVGDPVGAREDYSRSGAHAIQPTTARKPTYSATGPSVEHDGVDDLLKATYSLSAASRFAIAMAAWRADGSDRFDLTVPTVTNLTDEYYVQVEAGDSLQFTAPAKWDPNEFLVAAWGKPGWSSDDGVEHRLFTVASDGSNFLLVRKNASGDVEAILSLGGTAKVVALTPSSAWAAGDEIYVSVKYDGSNLILYFDTNGDGTLNTDSEAASLTSDPGAWTTYLGTSTAGAAPWDGGLNIAILNIGSSAEPITKRFNSGNGEDIQDWLAEIHPDSGRPYSEHLVAYLPKSKDGSEVKWIGFDGETYLDLPGASGAYASVPDDASLDITGDIDLQGKIFLTDIDSPPGGNGHTVVSKWKTSTSQRSYILEVVGGNLRVRWSTDGTAVLFEASTAALGTVVSDGDWIWVRGTLDVDDGSGNHVVTFYTGGSGDTPSWSQLGTAVTTAGTTSIFAGSFGVEVGTQDDNNPGWMLEGGVGHVTIKDGIGGTTVLDADFTNHWTGRTSFIEDSANAHTVTINGTAEIVLDPDSSSQLITNPSFEEYTAQGQYDFDGINDYISLGNWQGLDGATKFAFFGVFTADDVSSSREILSRWVASGDYRQLRIYLDSTFFRVQASADGTSGASSLATGSTVLSVGSKYAYIVLYDGSGGGNADRLKVSLSAFNPATGVWGGFVDESLGFSAAFPASLSTPGAATTAFLGKKSDGGSQFDGRQDDLRSWLGSNTPSLAQLKTLSVYDEVTGQPDGVPTPDHWWTMDGDADDQIGSLDGVVTGATQVADGRKPTGWIRTTAEYDRATGANQVEVGTYGQRSKRTPAGAHAWQDFVATVGRWYAASGSGRGVAGTPGVYLTDQSNVTKGSANLPVGASMVDVGVVVEADMTDGRLQVKGTAGNDEAYYDYIHGYELAEPAFSVASKATPSRVLWSSSDSGAGLPYIYMAITDGEKLEIGYRNDAGTRAEDVSAGAVTIGVHSFILEREASDLVAYLDNVEVCRLALSGTFTGMDTITLGGLSASYDGHSYDEKMGEVWGHGGPDFPGYTAYQRQELLEHLAYVTDGLEAP